MPARSAYVGWMFCLFLASPAAARELYVHVELGRDANDGSQAAPLATVQKAVSLAASGDVIHLLPERAVYRQAATFIKKHGITLDGHGCTLDGSDPLPTDGWETVSDGLHRRRLPQTPLDRHLLTVDGRTERMGRSTASNARPFPTPAALKDGEFCVEPIGEKEIWLYVRGPVDKLEWSTRVNGIGTGGDNSQLTIRNLNCRRFLNDGFNLHGHAKEIRFEHIDGYDCFDEGHSAHEDCTVTIEHGRFWGCENAVADVNDCESIYRHCEFSRSLGFDVLLTGARHTLVDCRIINTPTSTALSTGARGEGKTCRIELERVAITSSQPNSKPRVRLGPGEVAIRACDWSGIDVQARDAKIEWHGSERPATTK
jgi:hypothetical protein